MVATVGHGLPGQVPPPTSSRSSWERQQSVKVNVKPGGAADRKKGNNTYTVPERGNRSD